MAEPSAILGALAAALVLLARSRAPLLAGLALLAGGAVGIVLAFRPDASLSSIPTSAAAIAGIALAALGLAAAAAVLVRFPGLVILLLAATAPLRPPLDPDPGSSVLLSLQPAGMVGYHLPFYAVLAAATCALVWRVIRVAEVRALPLGLAIPAAALMGLTAISLIWSRDTTEGISQLMLFWLPFAALVAVVARADFPPWLPRALAIVVVAEGCAFAAIGVAEWLAGSVLFYTPGLEQVNATSSIFRVTSLFQDPSIYGRHVVVAIAVVLVLLWLGRVRVALAAPALALLATGLYFSYSQSSFVALVVVAAAIALAAGDATVRRAILVSIVVVSTVGVLVLGVALLDGSADRFTRNRSSLVTNTALVFRNHPVVGVGVGGQPVASREEADTGTTLGRNASHTTPLTIAAELGVLGVIAYVALLVGAARLLVAVRRRHEALGLGMAAVLLVLFVHSLFYDGFFEEPTTWGILAAAVAALACLPRPAVSRPSARRDSVAAPG